MKFRLLYEGSIAPRQKIALHDIHAIRKQLDPQLKALWEFEPLQTEGRSGYDTTRKIILTPMPFLNSEAA